MWSTAIRVSRLEPALERIATGGGSRITGPLGIGDDGRLAIVADPAGVAFGLWKPPGRGGAELAGQANTWAMSSLHAGDPERAAAFYGEVFGWELEPGGEAPFARRRLDGRLVAVLTATDGTAVPPHWAVNLAVADVDAVTARAWDLAEPCSWHRATPRASATRSWPIRRARRSRRAAPPADRARAPAGAVGLGPVGRAAP